MIKVFTPEQPSGGGDVAIVSLNQAGSSQRFDAGRDAEMLANHFGVPVIGVDRPGSGLWIPRPGLGRRLSLEYVKETAKLGRKVQQVVAGLGDNPEVIVAGRSAAGLGGIALTYTETMNVTSLYAAEPVGDYETTTQEGKKHHRLYLTRQSSMVADTSQHPGLIRPNPTDTHGLQFIARAVSIVPLFLTDSHHNGPTWATPISLSLAEKIAEQQRTVRTQIDFAQTSMVLSPDNPDANYEQFAALQTYRGRASDAPFIVARVPDTVHSSFDNRDFFAQRLALASTALQSLRNN